MSCSIRGLVALAIFATVTVTAADAPKVDAAALTAMQNMSAYLRTLKAFEVVAETTREEVLDDGEKVQYASATTIVARMPDRLRADVEGDRNQRLYLYDGKTFTLVGQTTNRYATIPAPATIAALADQLDDSYDLSIPLEDLFRWGTEGAADVEIVSAKNFGASVVDGTTCQHYGYRGRNIDWQLWIQLGDYPLPRKLVITTKTDEARPQYSAVYTWNLTPSFNEAAFTFDPPPGAERIVLAGSTTEADQ